MTSPPISVEDIVNDFIDQWDNKPDVAAWVDRYCPDKGPLRTRLVEALLAADLELSHAAGQSILLKEYLARYAGLTGNSPGTAPPLKLIARDHALRKQNDPALLWSDYLKSVPPEYHESLAPLKPQPRYRQKDFIGKGGQGDVWLAADAEVDRDVALKLLKQGGDDPESRARLIAEARITSRLEHPGIVAIYGLEESDDGRTCYAMRHVKGQTLTQKIKEYHQAASSDTAARDRGLRDLLNHFVAVCQTVAFAHDRPEPMIHRDLKPDNVMVGAHGETVVMDWGCAIPKRGATQLSAQTSAGDFPKRDAKSSNVTADPDATLTGGDPDATINWDAILPPNNRSLEEKLSVGGNVVGTPAYMSPEQARGAVHQFDQRTDVYGLGATLYHLLANQPPFGLQPDESVKSLLRRLASASIRPRPPREVCPRTPRALDAICRKALEPFPNNRYSSAAALAEDVQNWLADAPVSAYRENWMERTGRWIRKHPGTVGVGVVVLLALSIIFLVVRDFAQRSERDVLIKTLVTEKPQAVPEILRRLKQYPSVPETLRNHLKNSHPDSEPGKVTDKHGFRLQLGLVPFEHDQAKEFMERLLELDLPDPEELILLRDVLHEYRADLPTGVWNDARTALWERLEDPAASLEASLRAASALALFDARNPNWTKALGERLAQELTRVNALHLPAWANSLKPVAEHLRKPLQTIFQDEKTASPNERLAAAQALGLFESGDVGALVGLVLNAAPEQHAAVTVHLLSLGDAAVAALKAKLKVLFQTVPANEEANDRRAIQAANVALALLRFNPIHFDGAWFQTATFKGPHLRTELIHRLPQAEIDPKILFDRLLSHDHLPEKKNADVRQALFLALGNYPANQISPGWEKKWIEYCQKAFREEDNPGIHSAAEWCLRRLGREAWLDEMHQKPLKQKSWWINGQGHTMIRIQKGTKFWMGARPGETGYAAAVEPRYQATVARSFAIASKEVSVQQMEAFFKKLDAKRKKPTGKSYRQLFDPKRGQDDQTNPKTPDQHREPASFLTFTVAAAYCNWLSAKEGIPQKEWCYAQTKIDDLLSLDWPGPEFADTFEEHKLVSIPVNLKKTGYRLPTEIEWEFACGGGHETKYPFGNNKFYLGKYALHRGNSFTGKFAPVGSRLPNDLGLFDMLGNVAECCQDWRDGKDVAKDQIQKDGLEIRLEFEKQVKHNYVAAVRGGSFNDRDIIVRPAYRLAHPVTSPHIHDLGFRVACTLPE